MMSSSGVPRPAAAASVPPTEPNRPGNRLLTTGVVVVFLLSDKGNCENVILLSASLFCIKGYM